MKASIVIPVYNMAQYVGQCLDSVLRQSCGDWEIIVVDDCSTDDSVIVVSRIMDELLARGDRRILLKIREANGGVTAALNDGFRAALGDYICPLACDDMLEPWMIEKQSAYLDANPECAAVFGMPVPITDDGTLIEGTDRFRKPYNRSRAEWMSKLLEGNMLMGQTMLYRSSLHKTLGYWDEKTGTANDVDWFIRIVKEHDIHVQHIPMARIRMRGDPKQLSADSTKNRQKFADEMAYIRAKHVPENPKVYFSGQVIIASPVPAAGAHSRFITSLLASTRCLEKLGVEWDWWSFEDKSDRSKNSICAKFLESDATDLFFIDSDLEWSPLGLLRVLTNPQEVVGGTFITGQKWSALPIIKDGNPQGVMNGESPLLEAEVLSSTFMRVKKTALQKFRDKYPELQYEDAQSEMAKDYRVTGFFAPWVGLTSDEMFSCRMHTICQLWLEPQIEFKTSHREIVTLSLDQFYRDMNQQQTQLKVA